MPGQLAYRCSSRRRNYYWFHCSSVDALDGDYATCTVVMVIMEVFKRKCIRAFFAIIQIERYNVHGSGSITREEKKTTTTKTVY